MGISIYRVFTLYIHTVYVGTRSYTVVHVRSLQKTLRDNAMTLVNVCGVIIRSSTYNMNIRTQHQLTN